MRESILIIDDDADVLHASELALRHLGVQIFTTLTPEAIPDLLAKHDVSVILLDMNFQRGNTSSEEGLKWISEIKKRDMDVAVIVVTAHAGVALAVEAMKRGANDFITKPWTNDRLATTVRNAIELRATRRSATRLKLQAQELAPTEAQAATNFIGASTAMQEVMSLIARVAPTAANVLILGENGSGKELVARALHRASTRAASPMVSVDLGAVTASLFESELFGHKKGAFTDAKADRIGRIPAADGGTLFLDEIGNLPLTLQPKLLSALEMRQVTPVGANSPIAVDVRVVSATNLTREQLADEKIFRPDLLFRLNTVEIHLPPLRQRRDDIALLAKHFLAYYTHKYDRPPKPFNAAALDALIQYDWPGNVRALRHAIERAVILGRGDNYTTDDLALPNVSTTSNTNSPDAANNTIDDLNLDRMEQQLIERALKKNAWNISLTAKDLGLTRASLYRRMERYGL